MIFLPKTSIRTQGSFILSESVNAVANPALNNSVFKELWHNFSFQTSHLNVSETNELVFLLGEAEKLPIGQSDYTINVTKSGIAVSAKNEQNLIHAFFALLDLFKMVDKDDASLTSIDCVEIYDKAEVETRMVHFCICAHTTLYNVRRFVRFVAALRYTHIIFEFFGTYKFDCMPELAWPTSFTKEDMKPIIDEAKALGLEIIPMFNHWGHASASGMNSGKHVVLDQNPALQSYFSEDGWCWDVKKPKVRELLSKIRCELIELCGDGDYFHIGCDEAFNFEITGESISFITDFINETKEEIKKLGRRTIVWGDMFLYYHTHYNKNNVYSCNAPSPEAEKYFIENLDKDIIIADWQYTAKHAPIETVSVFTEAKFDTIICPWDRGRREVEACVKTAKDYSLFGVMHTTWSSISDGIYCTLLTALNSFDKNRDMNGTAAKMYSTALMRRVMPSGGDFQKAGFNSFNS